MAIDTLTVYVRPRISGMWRVVLLGWAIKLSGLEQHVSITMETSL